MKRLDVSGAVRPIYASLGVKWLKKRAVAPAEKIASNLRKDISNFFLCKGNIAPARRKRKACFGNLLPGVPHLCPREYDNGCLRWTC